MKRIILLSFLTLTTTVIANGQVFVNTEFTSDKTFSSVTKGKPFKVIDVYYDLQGKKATATGTEFLPSYVLNIEQSGKEIKVAARDFPKNITFTATEDNLLNYWTSINISSLKTISEFQDLYKSRSEMEADANEYVANLSKFGLIFDEPYLESYLYSIVSKIVPGKRVDGFPYELRIIILRDDSMNACVFPNGTMIINTGLLAAIHTEDELVAALSHEIAHFEANHTLVNMRAMEKKIARAEFWAAFATAAAAATEVYSASQGNRYVNGSLTMNTAILSTAIAEDVISRLGAKFNREQEKEADEMAINVLKYLGYDSNGAASLFQRMADSFNLEGNWVAYYITGDHPSLAERIGYSGIPSSKRDQSFEKKISFAVTEAAITKYQNGRFTQALNLVSQNINNNVGTDDDYLIKALCTMNLFNDNTHNREALSLIHKAKEINPSNANIRRTEIISLLRLEQFGSASDILGGYMRDLAEQMDKETNRDSANYIFLSEEYDWARKMMIKAKGL